MKIAVTSRGAELDSAVDSRFGRARSFFVIDVDSDEFSVHDNAQNLNAPQGAGVQAARTAVDLGVSAVVTGNVGPKAYAALHAAGVEVYLGASGKVRQAVAQFKAGELQQADEPNVEGHWT